MQAIDIMTTSVITIPQDAKIAQAVRLMLEHHISALPVVDADGGLTGLISEGDLMRRIRAPEAPRRSWWLELLDGPGNAAHDFVMLNSQRITDVMSREIVSVEEDTPVGTIARLLDKHRIKRVPVLRDGRVVGIVSRANLLQALASVPDQALQTPPADDRALRTRVDAALKEVPEVAVNLITYTVKDGHVVLWGVADSDTQEKAIRVAVENVPGVRSTDVQMGRLPAWSYGI